MSVFLSLLLLAAGVTLLAAWVAHLTPPLEEAVAEALTYPLPDDRVYLIGSDARGIVEAVEDGTVTVRWLPHGWTGYHRADELSAVPRPADRPYDQAAS